MTLREARVLFSQLVGQLPRKAQELGLELAFDQLKRPPELAKLYEAQGIGVAKSAHLNGLAVDVVLYRDGKYLSQSVDYAELGAWWKTLHPYCRWGGDFTKRDGNHFSLEFEGVA